MKPRLLDLFCCAGGAARGYADAGFEVVGVDIDPQPNYPFEFVQMDAMSLLPEFIRSANIDAVHASPPCPHYSFATKFHPGAADNHPDLVDPVRELLLATGLPFVIENVPGAPLRRDLVLCGEMFGLRVHRHRLFEVHGPLILQPKHQRHRLKGARTNCHIEDGYTRLVAGHFADLADASDAMGIDWMTADELRNAIPPAYTKFIGEQLLAHLQEKAA